jgi:hypothetical protein
MGSTSYNSSIPNDAARVCTNAHFWYRALSSTSVIGNNCFQSNDLDLMSQDNARGVGSRTGSEGGPRGDHGWRPGAEYSQQGSARPGPGLIGGAVHPHACEDYRPGLIAELARPAGRGGSQWC